MVQEWGTATHTYVEGKRGVGKGKGVHHHVCMFRAMRFADLYTHSEIGGRGTERRERVERAEG